MKILVKLAFVGTHYYGWQSQKNGRSVQECVTDAASKLFGFECDITGCSRTDSGVHANEFCATISQKGKTEILTTIPMDALPRAINCFLPEDISVFEATYVADDFHPRYNVKYKEYIYKIYTRPARNAFFAHRAWHYPKKLNVDAMNEAAALLVGTQDFRAFMAKGSKIVDTCRTVVVANVIREDDTIIFRIGADGFLYNMVRIITGTLIEVGEGRIEPSSVETIIKEKNRSLAGITAPACGLYLDKVYY